MNVEKQIERKNVQIVQLEEELKKIDEANKEEEVQQSLFQRWKKQFNEDLADRFRSEIVHSSVDWQLKSKLQEVCPFEYYEQKVSQCMNRSISNLLNVRLSCSEELDQLRDCSRMRQEFHEQYKQWERKKRHELDHSMFYVGSGVDQESYKKHTQQTNKEFSKLMESMSDSNKVD